MGSHWHPHFSRACEQPYGRLCFRRLLAAQVETRKKEEAEKTLSLRATLGLKAGKPQANGAVKPSKTDMVLLFSFIFIQGEFLCFDFQSLFYLQKRLFAVITCVWTCWNHFDAMFAENQKGREKDEERTGLHQSGTRTKFLFWSISQTKQLTRVLCTTLYSDVRWNPIFCFFCAMSRTKITSLSLFFPVNTWYILRNDDMGGFVHCIKVTDLQENKMQDDAYCKMRMCQSLSEDLLLRVLAAASIS